MRCKSYEKHREGTSKRDGEKIVVPMGGTKNTADQTMTKIQTKVEVRCKTFSYRAIVLTFYL
jgi:hypothetical protein